MQRSTSFVIVKPDTLVALSPLANRGESLPILTSVDFWVQKGFN